MMDRDWYIAATYIPPERSRVYEVYDCDLFKKFEDEIGLYSQLGRVMWMGDLNSRVGQKRDYIEQERLTRLDFSETLNDMPPVRKSADRKCNRFGDYVLDVCKATNICIVNGRTESINDSGRFTCYTHNGESVIDYLLTSYNNFNRFKNFAVHSYNEYSNHSPVSFEINIGYCHEDESKHEQILYKWKENMKQIFLSDLEKEKQEVLDAIIKCDTHTKSGVETAVSLFTDYITNKAEQYFKKTIKTTNSTFLDNKKHERKRWFTNECESKRKLYREALERFNCERNTNNFETMKTYKKDYKNFVRKTKTKYNMDRGREMHELRRLRPKEFWKKFKQQKQNPDSSIKLEEFYNHFKNLAQEQENGYNENIEEFLSNFDSEHDHPQAMYEELDEPISEKEIIEAVKKLNRNKATGLDNILNEYFIEGIDVLIQPLNILFNKVFELGELPRQWSEGVIIPVLKKQPSNDVNNYRGITLLSCLGKLFTSILNERLRIWSIKYDKLTDAQFGFKANHSTVDAIFILHNLINTYLNDKKRVYAAFVDYRKCFDLIYRQGLWYKLIKEGIDGKLLKLFRSMYMEVKSCVKHINTVSDFFNSEVGLFQGEITSPILFCYFVNDLETCLHNNIYNGLTLEQLNIYLLMFADDCVLLSDSAEGLQLHLNQLQTYCEKWYLKVNVEKTKIVIFRKGRLPKTEQFTFNGDNIEIVEYFNYLGFVLSSGGSFRKGIETIAGKALKSMFSLNNLTKNTTLTVRISFDLFDAYVTPVLTYCSELWGFQKTEVLERVHRKFLKWTLGVKMTTNNYALYGETGRYPLRNKILIRILKYWFKLINSFSTNCILYSTYMDLLLKTECNATNWLSNVKQLLQQTGFNDVWLYHNSVVNIPCFLAQFKLRLNDLYIGEWQEGLTKCSSLNFYREFKLNFGLSEYLNILINKKHRKTLSKLRLSSHDLHIQKGRYSNIPRADRLCVYCEAHDIEDEYHFILICRKYKQLRQIYIPAYYRIRPSMVKFIDLVNTNNKKLLLKLSNFITNAFKLRTDDINLLNH